MSHHHHHYETNPHFARLPSQKPHLKTGGGASTSQTSPHQPIIPPIPHHKKTPKSHPVVVSPGIQIKPNDGRQRQKPIQEPAHTVIPLPLSPENKLPPRKTPNSSKRPLLLSPEGNQPPPRPQRIGGGYGSTLPPIPKPSPWRTAPTPSPHHRRGQRLPPPERETNAMTWSAAFCCAIFWIILILGGLIVLIVYLVYRPRSPYIDISAANLNAAYLDMGFLLNGDLTILANFTNPSKKSSVDFSYVTFELYYYNTLIATQYVDPFKVPKKMSMFANVHLVSSQVQLQPTQSRELQRQIETGPVLLNLRGTFHARSNLGTLFRYSYWLHTHCSFSLNSPPSGSMRARRCNTKR
ncbi:NDR1/HIN1-like protein 13 [Cardamine amara subsp. amara]|uniref:NDR1/HIN1-like protein 13 n=1 Tax=Cardamine amara subsp. amara TaxID=228776 RepID=A0ABD1AAS0_CARAN